MKLYIMILGYDPKILGDIDIESGDTIKSVNKKVLDFYRSMKVKYGGDKVPPADANFLCATWLNEMEFSEKIDFCASKHFDDKASFSLFVKDLIKNATTDDDLEKLRLLRDYSVDDVRVLIAHKRKCDEVDKYLDEVLKNARFPSVITY